MEKRRSSLKTGASSHEDLKKMFEKKSMNIQFDLEVIKETTEKEELKVEVPEILEKEVKFNELRRQSLKNEYKIAQELLYYFI